MKKLQTLLNNLIKCKTPQELINEGEHSGLKKTLNGLFFPPYFLISLPSVSTAGGNVFTSKNVNVKMINAVNNARSILLIEYFNILNLLFCFTKM